MMQKGRSHFSLGALITLMGLEIGFEYPSTTQLTDSARVRTLFKMASLIRVRAFPITARVGTLYPQVVDLQSDSVVRERVLKCDLCAIVWTDIVARVNDWSYTLLTEAMPTWGLRRGGH